MAAIKYTAAKGLLLLNTAVAAWFDSTTVETLFTTELEPLGAFDSSSDISSWGTTSAGTTLSWDAGEMKVDNTDSTSGATKTYTVTNGKTYTISVDVRRVLATTAQTMSVEIFGAGSLGSVSRTDDGILTITVVSNYTTMTVRILNNYNNASYVMWIDNVSVQDGSGIVDITGNLNNLMVVGSPNTAGVNTNSELTGLGGFSSTNYAERKYDPAFGTSGFSILGWIKDDASLGAPSNTVFDFSYYDGTSFVGSAVQITTETNDALAVTITDDGYTTNDSVAGTVVIRNNGYKHFALVRVGNALSLYINGVLDTSITMVAALLSLTNSSAQIRVGESNAGGSGFINGRVSLLQIHTVGFTSSQVLNDYNSAKDTFRPERIYTQVGKEYSRDILMGVSTPSKKTLRSVVTTLDGSTSSLKHYTDELLSMTTLPVERKDFDIIRNFLESVDNGQLFTVDEYGTVAVPYESLSYKVTASHNGFEETRLGANHFQASIKAVRA